MKNRIKKSSCELYEEKSDEEKRKHPWLYFATIEKEIMAKTIKLLQSIDKDLLPKNQGDNLKNAIDVLRANNSSFFGTDKCEKFSDNRYIVNVNY
jgi:hypothetical protein